MLMSRWSEDSACCVIHNVQLYSVLSGEAVWCSVVFGTLVGVIWSELLMTYVVLCAH